MRPPLSCSVTPGKKNGTLFGAWTILVGQPPKKTEEGTRVPVGKVIFVITVGRVGCELFFLWVKNRYPKGLALVGSNMDQNLWSNFDPHPVVPFTQHGNGVPSFGSPPTPPQKKSEQQAFCPRPHTFLHAGLWQDAFRNHLLWIRIL